MREDLLSILCVSAVDAVLGVGLMWLKPGGGIEGVVWETDGQNEPMEFNPSKPDAGVTLLRPDSEGKL
jgi:hypothetical protein